MSGFPEIPKVRQGLVEASCKTSYLEDSGLDLNASRPSTAASGRTTARSPSSSAKIVPSPPPGGPGLNRTVKSSAKTCQRTIEGVYISRSELERSEQTIKSLRSEVIQKQAEIRELGHHHQDYATLQGVCEDLARAMGCSVEAGVATSTIREILLARTNSLLQEHEQASDQLKSCRTELEQCQGDMAAVEVRLSSAEAQLDKESEKVKQREADAQQTKSELELLRQNSARTGATVEALRKQLEEAQRTAQEGSGQSSSTAAQIVQLQTDIGKLKRTLIEKEDVLGGIEAQLSAEKADKDNLRERLTDSEAMYADLCLQLALSLNVSTDSNDLEHLISQVSEVMEECAELRQHCETLSTTVKAAELNSVASRETIMRLISQNKQHDSAAESARKLHGEVEELRASLADSQQSRALLQERLTATQDSVASLEQQVQAKEERLSEVLEDLQAARQTFDGSKLQAESLQTKYVQLVKALSETLSIDSTEGRVLLAAVADSKQKCSWLSDQLGVQVSLLAEKEACIQSLQRNSLGAEEDLERERSKVSRLEEELDALVLQRDGLMRDLEKSQEFSRKVAKAVELDRDTSEILAGDFAHDAILMKAQQLVKHESEMVTSRQTAIYSLQRKLKTCRRALESKELHLSLLQSKVEGLEQRLRTASHSESEWKTAVNKLRTLERQFERVQERASQQRNTITHLQADSRELQRLQEHCTELERDQAELLTKKRELEQTCTKQSQQLAEARQKTRQRQSQGSREVEELRGELSRLHAEVEELNEHQGKLSVFKTAVQRLLVEYTSSQNGDDPDDYELIATLEQLISSHKRHSDNAKCLETSLRQLELGFKTSYKDTLTILSSNSNN